MVVDSNRTGGAIIFSSGVTTSLRSKDNSLSVTGGKIRIGVDGTGLHTRSGDDGETHPVMASILYKK